MARPGITYKQVADAAQALADAGNNPTIGAVREALGGTGSPNTIHKHLAAWKEGSAQPVARTAEFPARLIQALQDELSKATMLAREQVQVELLAAQSEAIELARAGEVIEANLDELNEIVKMLTSQRDKWEAIEEELRADIARLHQVEQIERANAAKAQTEADRALAMLEAEKAKSQAQASEIASLRKELALTVKERQDAFQENAVRQAEMKAAERRASEADAREKATAAKLERAENEVRQERDEVTKSRVHIQSQQIALDTAARELETLRKKANVKPEKAKPANNQVTVK